MSAKTDRSGWDKRQATLILYIFADGIPRLPPKIIFHGVESGTIQAKEGHLYAKDVTIHFNSSAYNNKKLTVKWIQKELIPVL